MKPAENIQSLNQMEKILNDESIPETKREELKQIFASLSVQERFSGPLPPPEALGRYNNVLKNGAERIMQMAETQSKHRIALEKHAVKEKLKQSRNGQWFGFILGILGMGVAAALALSGHDTVAGIFGTTTIAGLVTVFVIGRKK